MVLRLTAIMLALLVGTEFASAQPAPAVTALLPLEQCMAHVATDPRFVSQTNEQLGTSVQFAEVSQHYCSDEIGKLWSLAHTRARARLGLPEKGPIALEQQKLAEEEMDRIVLSAWPDASKLRANPPALGQARTAKFVLAWLLEGPQTTNLLDHKAALCAKAQIGNSALPMEDFQALYVGRFSPAMNRLLKRCGYAEWRQRLADATVKRFADVDSEVRVAAIDWLLGQLTFSAALSYP